MVKEGKWVRWGDVKVRHKVCVSMYNAKEKMGGNDRSGEREGKNTCDNQTPPPAKY